MEMKRMTAIHLFASSLMLLFTALLTIQIASAFTVSPALRESEFTPDPQQFIFTVKNQDPSLITIHVDFEGELAQYARGPVSLTLPPNGAESVIINLDLPEELTPPGNHEMLVIFREERLTGGTVSAAAELAPKIRIKVPYEGSYLDFLWAVQDGQQPLFVTVMLENLGKTETGVTPVVTLFRIGDEEGFEQEGGQVLLAGGAEKRLTLIIPEAEASPGAYGLTLFLTSTREPALNNKEETTTVWLGTPSFTIESSSVSRFLPGEIGRITIEAKSDWNTALATSVSATVIDETGRLWDLATQELIFEPGEMGSFSFIWESDGAEAGPHTIELECSPSRSSGSVSATFVLPETLGLTGLGAAASARFPVILVLLVLLLSLSGYLLWRRKRGL